MTYTFDDLKADVKKEAEALRKNATSEELGRLSVDELDPGISYACIYGQMTTSCASERAHELIKICCQTYVLNEEYDPKGYSRKSDKAIPIAKTKQPRLNKVRSVEFGTYLKYLSAIEAYILLPEAKNAELIAYLRGETDNLDL